MITIIFLSLFTYIYNLYPIEVGYIAFFQRKSKDEYIAVRKGLSLSDVYTFYVKTDNFTIVEEKTFDDRAQYFYIYKNNLIVYSFHEYAIIEYKGKANELYFYDYIFEGFVTHTYSHNRLLFCTYHYINTADHPYWLFHSDLRLNLVEYPYEEISKKLTIDSGVDLDNDCIKLIALKDCFIYLKFVITRDNEGNATYAIVDFDLNIINTINKEYKNLSLAEHSQLSQNGKVNEFFLCLKYIDNPDLQCQIIKYQNKDHLFLKPFNIYYPGYDYTIKIFDENKIGIIIKSIYQNINVL